MTATLEPSAYLATLRSDTAAFRSAITAAPLDSPIAACPGWTVTDLLWHLAEVHSFWGSIVIGHASSPDEVTFLERLPDEQLLACFDEQSQRLIDALSTTEPSTTVWTWAPDHDVAFVQRRMAQETAVHRWDAELAAGRPTAIDAALASDGIDEFLDLIVPSQGGGDPVDRAAVAAQVGGSVHIHCTDTAGEWTARPTADGWSITREHAKGDCALRGTASDLLLALWRRTGSDTIDIVGDADVAARFLAATDLGME
jgi:uncharacterized protein (TIGR03083 family)